MSTMKAVKVAEATNPQIDWLVAKASGRFEAYIRDEARPGLSIMDIGFDENRALMVYTPGNWRNSYGPWSPTTDWSQGGPIIEREGVELVPDGRGEWDAAIRGGDKDDVAHGPTPLIAAMRCFVASSLGDTVQVPEEL